MGGAAGRGSGPGRGRSARGAEPGLGEGGGDPAPSRRTLLRWAAGAGALAIGAPLLACAPPPPPPGVDANGLLLRPGFRSRVVARAGEPVAGTGPTYRSFPDGAGTIADPAVPGGWYLTVNHEVGNGGGGVTALRFGPDGALTSAASICDGTSRNCAGGTTPWGSWLTCEEVEAGLVWECWPTGGPAVARPAMGAFTHEAAAVAADGRVYLTEDRSDGALYRFTPHVAGDLSAGLLEVAVGSAAPGATLSWAPVPDPSATTAACRDQVPGAARFDGGEGIDARGQEVWFTTKGDDRVWAYDLGASLLSLRHQGGGASPLSGVDNLLADEASGALLVAEDGGDLQVVALLPDGSATAVVQVPGHVGSELAGPCFSPDGTRFYVSSQRAPSGPLGLPLGVTYEVEGPWGDLLGRP